MEEARGGLGGRDPTARRLPQTPRFLTNRASGARFIGGRRPSHPAPLRMRDADAAAVLPRRAPARPAGRPASAEPGLLADLWELLKPGITGFVVATAAAGYLVGAPAGVDGPTLAALLVGTALTAGGSGALNHFLERGRDAQMKRTRDRPLPAGRLSPAFVLAYGVGVLGIGLAILAVLTNGLTAALAGGTAAAYLALYTPLKRLSAWNTLVGAVPGALPALGGYAAATGGLGVGGWAVFAIVFLWQFPHFLSLAWMYREDYARGGFAMLPVRRPDGLATARVALGAALALLLAGIVPAALGLAGGLYFAGMLALGTWFTLPAFSFAAEPTPQRARRLLLASIAYVPAFFALVALDYVLRLAVG